MTVCAVHRLAIVLLYGDRHQHRRPVYGTVIVPNNVQIMFYKHTRLVLDGDGRPSAATWNVIIHSPTLAESDLAGTGYTRSRFQNSLLGSKSR